MPVKPHQVRYCLGMSNCETRFSLGKTVGVTTVPYLILTGHHHFQHLLTVESAGPYTKPFLHSWVI